MWGQDPPPYAQLAVCLYVLLLPYLDDIVVLFMELHGQEVGSVFVPHGLELSPMLHNTCFRCNAAPNMFISVEFFSLGGMDHVHAILTLEEQFMGDWLIEHLTYDGDWNLGDPMNEGELIQLLP